MAVLAEMVRFRHDILKVLNLTFASMGFAGQFIYKLNGKRQWVYKRNQKTFKGNYRDR